MSGILGLDKLGEFTLGVSTGLNLVTNRTAANLEETARLAAIPFDKMTAEQQTAWLTNLRGAYNASDLNRVETAVAQLCDILHALPLELREYAASLIVAWDDYFEVPYDAEKYFLTVKTDWTNKDIPLPPDMRRYLGNVATLRGAMDYTTADLPASMENLTWSGANAIERALEGLNSALIAFRTRTKSNMDKTAAAWYYSGELYSGEV